jgi:hypothetical protein
MLTKKAKSETLRGKFNEFFTEIEGLTYAGQLPMSFDVHMRNLGVW